VRALDQRYPRSAAKLLIAVGQLQRQGGVIDVVAGHLADRTDLLRRLGAEEAGGQDFRATIARADKMKRTSSCDRRRPMGFAFRDFGCGDPRSAVARARGSCMTLKVVKHQRDKGPGPGVLMIRGTYQQGGERSMQPNRRQFIKASAATAATASLAPWIARRSRAADEVVIAELHDLSGVIDLYGTAFHEGFTLAVEETNAAGGLLGRPVRVITYDTQSNNQLYAQYAQQAAVKDQVSVVHGGITSASREVIRPILRRFNTLYFYNSNYEGGVCDRNCFCVGMVPGHHTKALVDYTVKNLGKKIYTIAADYNYGQIIAAWVRKYGGEIGAEVIGEEFFPLDVTSFGPTISKIQAAKPDFIWSALVGTAHLAFYRQWAAAGMVGEIPIASTVFGAGTELSVLSPEETEGFLVAYSYFETLDTPENKAWVEKFRTKFNRPQGYLNDNAMNSYLGWKMYAAAVEQAGTTDRMPVIEALESGIEVPLPTAVAKMHGPSHHCIRDVSIAQVHDNAYRIIETFPQLMPADTAAVCDLQANPNENQQYQPQI
jgi:branched-chain amino acid transport system substrate-binding protein